MMRSPFLVLFFASGHCNEKHFLPDLAIISHGLWRQRYRIILITDKNVFNFLSHSFFLSDRQLKLLLLAIEGKA